MPRRWNSARCARTSACPARLLTLGLPLTIVFGAGLALLLQPQEGLAFACLLGTILAPTDATSGAPDLQQPARAGADTPCAQCRSGSNDGIATPFVLLLLALAAATGLQEQEHFVVGAISEILLAGVAGAGIGLVGGY